MKSMKLGLSAIAAVMIGLVATSRSATADVLAVGGNYFGPLYQTLTGQNGDQPFGAGGGDIHYSTFSIGAGPANPVIIYCVDMLNPIGVPQTFSTLTYDPNPFPNNDNTWNDKGIIINDDSAYNPNGQLQNAAQIAYLMEKYSAGIHAHVGDNSNVGTINGVNFQGTAAEASLALQGALWKEVYGPAYTLDTFLNSPNVVNDYDAIFAAGVGSGDIGGLFWFNPDGFQQGLVGEPVPAPSNLVMLSILAGLVVAARGWKKARVTA